LVERFVYRAAAVRPGVGRMRREEMALPDRKSKLELSFGLGLSEIDE
jgi:hypothetical protein